MKVMLCIYVFIFCACIGSFANVLIYRLPKGENFIIGRSYCPKCHHTLKMSEMIPIFSWILLKGRCRWCHQKISIAYFIIEVISMGIGYFCFSYHGFGSGFFISFFICELLLVVSVIDLITMTIPDSLNIILAFLAIIAYCLHPDISLIERLIGMSVISLLMIVLNLFVMDSFGGGDIKLMIAAGFLLGWQKTLVAGVLGIMSASVYASYLLVKKKANRKTHIPFGPFLSLGIMISFFYGCQFIDMYLMLVKV